MTATLAPPTFETILCEKKSATAYVTLNRPQVLNALNAQAIAELQTAFEAARDDPSVRGVILTGAGDKAFIAGADISELAQRGRQRVNTSAFESGPMVRSNSR